MRTRIKICGLTREADVAAAVRAGADAVGFVCYAKSPRYVSPLRLRTLAREAAVFTTPVLLFVNASADLIEGALEAVPDALLQFHGDEHEGACARHGRPYMRAVRMDEKADLLESEREFHSAAALLLDAPAEAYGGSGTHFDWALVPAQRNKPVVLAGGLNAGNVAEALRRVRPYAVDISSGVEDSPGIKSAIRMEQFIAAVRAADQSLDHSAPSSRETLRPA
jgi:phosphoribosylanthranilate isomerase